MKPFIKLLALGPVIMSCLWSDPSFAGKNIGARCQDEQGSFFESLDLDPEVDRLAFLHGVYHYTNDRGISFKLLSTQGLKIDLVSYDETKAKIQIKKDDGSQPLFIRSSTAALPTKLELILLNKDAMVLEETPNNRKGEVILVFGHGEEDYWHFKECDIFGAKVGNWHKMWNP